MPKFLLFCLLCASLVGCMGHSNKYTGPAFIDDPDFKLFGANISQNGSSFEIKSYFQSSITGRTEYIYENFDITVPGNVTLDKPLDISGFKVRYAKGGQSGQIESKNAAGSVTVKSLSASECILELNVTFSDFAKTGVYDPPGKITRTGTLRARAGYKLY